MLRTLYRITVAYLLSIAVVYGGFPFSFWKTAAGGGGGGPAWVKNIANGSTANTTTYTFNTSATVGSGNTICFMWANSGTAPITGISGGGLTWTVDAQANSGQTYGAVHAYAPSGLASGTTITVTTSGAGFGSFFYDLEEFSGVNSSVTADTSNALSGAGFGTAYSCPVTTSQATLAFGCIFSVAGNTWSIGGSGYTVGTSPPVSFTDTLYPVWRILPTPTTSDPGGNYSAAQNTFGVTVALKTP